MYGVVSVLSRGRGGEVASPGGYFVGKGFCQHKGGAVVARPVVADAGRNQS